MLFNSILLYCTGCSGSGIVPDYMDLDGHVIVVTGDSIASHLERGTFDQALSAGTLEDLFQPAPDGLNTVHIVNTGIGGNFVKQIEGRFKRDCVLWHPETAVIFGGTNDLKHGTSSQESFISSWRSMLDMCRKHEIKAVVSGVIPSTSFSSELMRERDRWNNALRQLVKEYEGFIYIDPGPLVGQYREDGDEGNLWDIREEYDTLDGIHLSDEGYVALARGILEAITGVSN